MTAQTFRSSWPLKSLLVGLVSMALVGCASVPQTLRGDASQFAPIMANQASEQSVGQRVRWGGVLVNTHPKVDQTCMEVLARELDRSQRPIVRNDVHFGRFMACGQGFKDPAIFTQGREITVIGQVSGFSEGLIGEYTYRYPMVDIQSLYLWPERSEQDDSRWVNHAYYHGWWGPFNYPVQRVYVPVPPPKPKPKN